MKYLPALLLLVLAPLANTSAAVAAAPKADLAAVVKGNNGFAVDLYGRLREKGGTCSSRPTASPRPWP